MRSLWTQSSETMLAQKCQRKNEHPVLIISSSSMCPSATLPYPCSPQFLWFACTDAEKLPQSFTSETNVTIKNINTKRTKNVRSTIASKRVIPPPSPPPPREINMRSRVSICFEYCYRPQLRDKTTLRSYILLLKSYNLKKHLIPGLLPHALLRTRVDSTIIAAHTRHQIIQNKGDCRNPQRNFLFMMKSILVGWPSVVVVHHAYSMAEYIIRSQLCNPPLSPPGERLFEGDGTRLSSNTHTHTTCNHRRKKCAASLT